MKTMTLFGAVVLLCPFVAKAQNNCSQSISDACSVAQLITLNKVDDLNFGRIVAGATSGTVTVSSLGQASATGGPTVYSGSQRIAPKAASFFVTGEPGYAYTISTPASITVTSATNANDHMTVDFTQAPAAATVAGHPPSNSLSGWASRIAASGNAAGYDAWAIGGRLSLAAGQHGGSYTGSFSEQVQYQ